MVQNLDFIAPTGKPVGSMLVIKYEPTGLPVGVKQIPLAGLPVGRRKTNLEPTGLPVGVKNPVGVK
jgi:hypothetical protein